MASQVPGFLLSLKDAQGIRPRTGILRRREASSTRADRRCFGGWQDFSFSFQVFFFLASLFILICFFFFNFFFQILHGLVGEMVLCGFFFRFYVDFSYTKAGEK